MVEADAAKPLLKSMDVPAKTIVNVAEETGLLLRAVAVATA
jgi:hypothetical protein